MRVREHCTWDGKILVLRLAPPHTSSVALDMLLPLSGPPLSRLDGMGWNTVHYMVYRLLIPPFFYIPFQLSLHMGKGAKDFWLFGG